MTYVNNGNVQLPSYEGWTPHDYPGYPGGEVIM